ncbi:hypothetical protein [Lentzea cavernae]|uniref:Uncharacterized protein n=1 Tax=Lentzea cavernae TaxID=2020703 RepID=A0ABQ3MQB0_9PSEU|nr:hypothetical protein [Lentzea cavernae]GHH57490.1 hypothetical protein GCM10017774_77060 [Lentzea cavernae]
MTISGPWEPSQWPRRGCCGACGRPALEAPSRRWWHDGRPCLARSQSMWTVDSLDVRSALVFVAEGEPLPEGPTRWHLDPTGTDERGIPSAFDLCRTDHTQTVREWLARQAEETA